MPSHSSLPCVGRRGVFEVGALRDERIVVELDRVRAGRLEWFGRGRPGLGVVSLEVVDGAEDLAGGFVVGVPARFRRGRIR